MLRHVLIFLPVVVAALEVAHSFIGQEGRFVCLALMVVGFVACLKRDLDWRRMLRSAVISLGGAVATFYLANHLQLGSLVSSAVVGLVGARVFKDQEQSILYLGTFVGMSSLVRFPTADLLIMAGLLGGVL